MSLFGPPDIEKLKAKGKVKELIKALNYRKDPAVCLKAAAALGEMGNSRALEPLIAAAFRSEGKDLRIAAINSLGKLGDPRAVVPLLLLLCRPDAFTHTPAVEALEELPGEGRVRELIKALNYTKDPAVSRKAAVFLGGTGSSLALEPLIEVAVRGDRKDLRTAAIDSLGKLGDQRAAAPLVSLLCSPDSFTHAPAEKALTKLGAPAVDALQDGLRHRERNMRDQAARMLRKLGWDPVSEVEKASLWIAKRDFERLRELAYHSIKPLLLQYMSWERHPDDYYLNMLLARYILEVEKDQDDPAVSLATALLKASIREYRQDIDKMLSSPYVYEDQDRLYISMPMKLKFGEYAEIVQEVLSYERVVTDSWDVYEEYAFNTHRSMAAVKRLCRIETPVSSNLLHHFTGLRDVSAKTTNKHPTFGNIPTTTVSFERQRKMAADELARRGSPGYNVSIYMSEDCWRIQ